MLSGYYVSGLCANKLKKETKKNRCAKESIVLHCGKNFEHICSNIKSIFSWLYREAN